MKKSWAKYFLIILLILLMVFGGQHVFDDIRTNAQKTYNFNPFLQNILMIIFYGGIGLLMGLEHLIQEIKKEGTWEINIPKLVLIGIPSLYFSIASFVYYNTSQFVRDILSYPISILMKNSTNFISVFQLILGYSIITSFNKKKEEL